MEQALLPLFEHLTDGICLSGDGGRVLYLNPAAEKMLGISLAQVGECSLCELLCSRLATKACADCGTNCVLRDPAGPTRAVTIEGRHGPKPVFAWRGGGVEKTEQWHSLRVRCMKVETAWLGRSQHEKHLTIIEDATEQAAHEAEREDWRNMIAHDLRNPLTNIYGALRTLQDDDDPAAGRGAAIVDIGVQNCRRMIELLNLYLDVVKFDAGLMETSSSAVELAGIVRECVEEQTPLAQTRRIEVAVSVPAGLKAKADAVLLSRVVQNLLDNALKYTQEGGRVELSAAAAGAAVRLSVADNGPGVPEEEVPRLFDRYHQARARREGRSRGTGLGLAFCRQAILAMGGGIEVESNTGRGTRFTLELPLAG